MVDQESEKEYIEEFKSRCVDGKVSDRDRNMLNKLAASLDISSECQEAIENSLLGLPVSNVAGKEKTNLSASEMLDLGDNYYEGIGVNQSFTEAVKWYRKAAEMGNADAQCELGDCYSDGHGIEKNDHEAACWYFKSARQGNATAQLRIGFCYYFGKGVTQNYKEAVKWYCKSAEQGNSFAQNSLGYCYYNGTGVEQNYSEAVKWYRKAADQGYAPAQCSLGDCYYAGEGVEQDFFAAVKWYREAAKKNDDLAQWCLGLCYEDGIGVNQDYDEAVKWYRKSAEQGNSFAQKNLGDCYYNGIGVDKDIEEARMWYEKAAEQGDEDALNALKSIHGSTREENSSTGIRALLKDKKVKDEINYILNNGRRNKEFPLEYEPIFQFVEACRKIQDVARHQARYSEPPEVVYNVVKRYFGKIDKSDPLYKEKMFVRAVTSEDHERDLDTLAQEGYKLAYNLQINGSCLSFKLSCSSYYNARCLDKYIKNLDKYVN
jgi:TPR repeat protein